MTNLRNIGVLGGMGPEATVLLQQRLIDAVKASDDADHVPLIVHMNPQVPSRLEWILKGQGKDPGPVLAAMALSLERAGAQALVMPCNTAHHFAQDICEAVSIPLLHMVESAIAEVASIAGKTGKLGILASPAACDIRLFHDALRDFDIEPVFPRRQDLLLKAIQSVKSSKGHATAGEILNSAALECEARGANCLLLGCSEFSCLSEAISAKIPVVDAINVLVSDMIAFSGAVSR